MPTLLYPPWSLKKKKLARKGRPGPACRALEWLSPGAGAWPRGAGGCLPSSRPLSPSPPAAPLTRSLCSSESATHLLSPHCLYLFSMLTTNLVAGNHTCLFSPGLCGSRPRHVSAGPHSAAHTPGCRLSRGNIFRPFRLLVEFLSLWVGLRFPLSCRLLAGDHVAPRGHPRSLPCDPLHGSLTLPILLHLCV